MKNRLYSLYAILSGLLLLTLGGCEKTETTTSVTFNAKGRYGDKVLTINKAYPYGSMSIKLYKVSYFISDLRLIRSDNTELQLTDIYHFDLSYLDSTVAAKGASITFNNIPQGQYKGVRFGIGVSAALNAKQPGDFSSSQPLGNSADYWAAWKSYIFTKTEGAADKSGNGQFVDIFTYHTGANTAYREKTILKDFSIDAKGITLPLILDARKILISTNGTILDVVNKPSAHNPGDEPVAKFLMDNYVDALSIE